MVASPEDVVVDVSLEAAEVEGAAVEAEVEARQVSGMVSVGAVETAEQVIGTQRSVAVALQDKESEAPRILAVRLVVADQKRVGAA